MGMTYAIEIAKFEKTVDGSRRVVVWVEHERLPETAPRADADRALAAASVVYRARLRRNHPWSDPFAGL